MKSRLPLGLVQRCVSKSLQQPIFHFSFFPPHFPLSISLEITSF
jgi:hypothetical protein